MSVGQVDVFAHVGWWGGGGGGCMTCDEDKCKERGVHLQLLTPSSTGRNYPCSTRRAFGGGGGGWVRGVRGVLSTIRSFMLITIHIL